MSLLNRLRRFFSRPDPAPAVQSAGYQVIRVPVGSTIIEVAVWYPTLATPRPIRYGTAWVTGSAALDAPVRPGPWPLIVFSHGYSGSGVGSTAICERLAAAGYVVAAPDHSDAVTGSRISGIPTGGIDEAMLDLRDTPPSLAAHGYRADEVRAVIERMQYDRTFPTTNQVALIGHSLGGWTVFQAALSGVAADAIVSLSMGELHWLMRRQRFFGAEQLGRISVSVAYFYGGDEAEALRGRPTNAEYCCDATPNASLYRVDDGDHFVYVDQEAMRDGRGGTPEQLRFIADETIDFLRGALKGLAS